MFACEDSASIDCARLIRGIASIAKLVAPDAAIARIASPPVNGCRNPISTLSDRSRPISSDVGVATLTTTSASYTPAGSSTIRAPASSYWLSGISAPAPAPRSTTTSIPPPSPPRQLAHDLGHERHTSLALRRLLGDSDLHSGAGAYRLSPALGLNSRRRTPGSPRSGRRRRSRAGRRPSPPARAPTASGRRRGRPLPRAARARRSDRATGATACEAVRVRRALARYRRRPRRRRGAGAIRRAGAAIGSGLPSSAITASAVTHVGVSSVPRE